MIIRHQDNVAGFAGAHNWWFLPQQLISGPIAAAAAGLVYTTIGKFFLFTTAEWASEVLFKLEASFRSTSGGSVGVRLIDAASLAVVTNSEILTSSTTPARYRSAQIVLTDAREYRIQIGISSGEAGGILGAAIWAGKPV